MTNEMLNILLVEDCDDDSDLIRLALRRDAVHVERVDRLSAALERMEREQFDVILLDLSLPDSGGFETFARLKQRASREAIVVLTGFDDEALGLRTVRAGGQDYLVKDGNGMPLLIRSLRYAFERKQADEITKSYAEQLRARNAEMQDDLVLAREVQQAFLPQRYPTFPSAADTACTALKFSHRYVPAGVVGGDLFDIFRLSDDEAGVFICDVMGHGVRAALVTAMLRALVNEYAASAATPGKLLERLNDALRATLTGGSSPMFVSAFYLIANATSGELRYANAGHPSPLCVRFQNRGVESLRSPSEENGIALGLMESPSYPTGRARLEPGDRMLFFTDGVFDVEGSGGEQYGQARLQDVLREMAGLSNDQFLEELISALRRFAGDQEFSDDACLVAMDFVPEQAAQLSAPLTSSWQAGAANELGLHGGETD